MTPTPPHDVADRAGPGEQPYLLDNPVQHYAWGSTTVIPELLGTSPSAEPVAELWIGAHPGAPSAIAGSDPVRTLAELIQDDPARFLGPRVEEQFGQLPYLLKILAVARPLSLQAHPSRSQAEAGFAAEQAAAVAQDAAERNYKDANHKPEQVCALTAFEGLCGFRPLARTEEFLAALEQVAPDPALITDLRRRLRDPDGLSAVVGELLGGPTVGIEALLGELVPAAQRLHQGGERWAAEAGWVVELDRAYPGDRGTVIAALLNLVHLDPGQALFLQAGQLHAYLRGVAVEVMANSDNVLRGGLTPKNVDAAALLAILDVREEDVRPSGIADPDPPVSAVHWYPSAVPDFRLGRLDLRPDTGLRLEAGSPRELLCTDGVAWLSCPPGSPRYSPVELTRGRAAFAPAGAEVAVHAGAGRPATVYIVMPNTVAEKS